MKTIPVSLIVAGLLAPAAALAQTAGVPQAPAPAGGGGKPGPPRPFLDAWIAADTNHDGVINAQDAQFKTLLIALSFHQFFEGVALGARLFAASFRGLYDLSFLAVFSLAAPVGMAVGLGLLRGGSLNANGLSFLMTQGTLDGVTSGLLLHIAAAKLVVDFQRDVTVVSRDSWVRAFGLHVAVSIGAGCMAYLGEFL